MTKPVVPRSFPAWFLVWCLVVGIPWPRVLADPLVLPTIASTGSYPTRSWENGFPLGPVPAGTYSTYFIATDWSASGGSQWSTEARLALHAAPLAAVPGNRDSGPLDSGAIYLATAQQATNAGTGTTPRNNMYWSGAFSDPLTSDGTAGLFVSTRQTYAAPSPGANTATWSNVRVILDPDIQDSVEISAPAPPFSATDLGNLQVGQTNLTLPIRNELTGPPGISWYKFTVDAPVDTDNAFDFYTVVGQQEVDTRLSLFRAGVPGLLPVASTDDMGSLLQAGLSFGSADTTQFQRQSYLGTNGSWFNGRGGGTAVPPLSATGGFYANVPGAARLLPGEAYYLAVSQFSGGKLAVTAQEAVNIAVDGVVSITGSRAISYSDPIRAMGDGDVILTIRSNPAIPTLVWYGDGTNPGGGGNWTIDGLTWWNGTALQSWDSSARAVFPAGAGEIHVGDGVVANQGLAFNGDYTIAGQTVSMAGELPGATIFDVTGEATVEFRAPIITTKGLVFTGTGTATLAGPIGTNEAILVEKGVLALIGSPMEIGGVPAVEIQRDATLLLSPELETLLTTELRGTGTLAVQGPGSAIVTTPSPDFIGRVLIQGGQLFLDTPGGLGPNPPLAVAATGQLILPSSKRLLTQMESLSVNRVGLGGLIDLGAGQISILPNGFSVAELRENIVAGRSSGSWDGAAGITSSLAAESGGTRAVGYVIRPDGSAVISYAAAGDVNLDGQVDVFDLVSINGTGAYGSGTASDWSLGDFNYDGVTNVFDIVSINSAGTFARGSYFPTLATTSPSISIVPEPKPFSLLKPGLSALGSLLWLRLGRQHFLDNTAPHRVI